MYRKKKMDGNCARIVAIENKHRSQAGNISPLKIIPVSVGSRIALGPRIKRKKWELNRISQIYSDAFRGGEDAGSARKSLFKF